MDSEQLLFSSATQNWLDGVTVNGDLDLTAGVARVRIRNGLTLNGDARLDNNGAIGFSGDQTFDNSSIVFEGNTGALSVDGITTLTLGPAMVVRGKSGNIGQPVFQGGISHLINEGLISADVAGGAFTINPTQFTNGGTGTVEEKNGGDVILSSASWSNAGLIAATGGTLTLDGSFSNTGTIQTDATKVDLKGSFTKATLGTFQCTGGAVQLTGLLNLAGDTLTLDATTGSWTLKGGTIRGGTVTQTAQGGLLITNSGQNTLDGVTVNGDLDLTATSARLRVLNGLTLNGDARIDNGGAIVFNGTQSFETGSVVFEGNSGSLGVDGDTTLTLGPAMVVRGKTGRIGQAVLQGGAGHLINEGLISADVAGGTLTINPTQFTNEGTVEEKNGGTIIVP